MQAAAIGSNAWKRRPRLYALLLACTAAAAGSCLSSAPASAAPATAEAEAAAPQPAWERAYAHGQWSAAIELLETIPESSRTARHWLHLARSLERGARLVEAFAAYERVDDLAANAGASAGMRDIERQAKAESSALAQRIPWAEVALERALPPGALVFIDQQWLEPSRMRSPYPVNPGWHTFLVESNGEVLAARRTFFEEGQTRLVPLTATASDLSTPAASLALGEPTAGARGATSPRSLTWRPDSSRHSVMTRDVMTRDVGARDAAGRDAGGLLKASYVSLGVGALGTLVGTGFLLSALNSRSSTDDGINCFSVSCDASSERATRAWRARASAATASYAIGLAGLVTGGVLWLLHRESAARSATVTLADLSLELAPRFAPHGAALRGRF